MLTSEMLTYGVVAVALVALIEGIVLWRLSKALAAVARFGERLAHLASALELLTDRATPREAGRALFNKVHAEWSKLPTDSRPMLVVGGESLGAYGGLSAFSDVDDMLARAQGGVWSGTPSFSEIADHLYASRTQGSPQISPVVDNGLHIRFETKDVNNGFGAGMQAKEYHPNLMVLDVMLPDINGKAVCELVRGDPSLSDIKIICISGLIEEDKVEELRRAGADDFLRKPLDVDELVRRVCKLLDLETAEAS